MRKRKAILAVLAITVSAGAVFAQGRGNDLRTLSGRIVTAQDQPVNKAVVYLKNTRTLAIKTYITEPDGSFRFTALSPNIDYEVYAEAQGARSDTKTLSAFDNRKQATITLKLHNGK